MKERGSFHLTYLSSPWVCILFKLLKERLRNTAINSVS